MLVAYIFFQTTFFYFFSRGFIFYFAMNVITKALSTSIIIKVLPTLNVPARLVIAENRLNNIRNMSYEIVERGAPNSLDYKLYFSK